mmetsp:Transcript_73756/g.192096  ORF Transcript_73756/g.192096 Transcript_73756/m.192096 type:complete len:241 (+) Transcript_73756:330-1052(+)
MMPRSVSIQMYRKRCRRPLGSWGRPSRTAAPAPPRPPSGPSGGSPRPRWAHLFPAWLRRRCGPFLRATIAPVRTRVGGRWRCPRRATTKRASILRRNRFRRHWQATGPAPAASVSPCVTSTAPGRPTATAVAAAEPQADPERAARGRMWKGLPSSLPRLNRLRFPPPPCPLHSPTLFISPAAAALRKRMALRGIPRQEGPARRRCRLCRRLLGRCIKCAARSSPSRRARSTAETAPCAAR